MSKTEAAPVKTGGRAIVKTKVKKKLKIDLTVYDVLARVAGILFARAVPFAGLAPFGLSFLAMERKFSLKSLVTYAMICLGYLTIGDFTVSMRYMIAGAVYEIFLFVLEKKETPSMLTAGSVLGGAQFVVGLGMLYVFGFEMADGILLLCDVLLMAIGMLVFEKGRALILEGGLKNRSLNFEEKLSLCIMAALLLLSVKHITLFPGFAVANILGALLVMILALAGGMAAAAAGGMAAGLLLGFDSDALSAMAVFGVCGLCAGALAKWDRLGVAAGFGLSGLALALYMGVASDTVLSYFELPAAVLLLFAVPQPVIRIAKNAADFGDHTSEEMVKLRTYIQERLGGTAESFRTLADTFAELADKQNTADMTDISLMFDTTADRVCRHCRHAKECWEHDFQSTYKTMFKFLEIMEKNGRLTADDAEPYFAERCVKLRTFVDEVNRQFEIYRINQVWKHKLMENRELVSEQFSGVAQIIESIAEDLEADVVFDPVMAEDVKQQLISRGVKVQAVEILRDSAGKYTAEISLSPGGDCKACSVMRTVLRNALGVNMVPPEVRCVPGQKTCKVHFCQAEGYDVSAGFAQGRMDQDCGDAHILHYLDGGKYVITLSDGMGTGRRAAKESSAIVELLGDFLRAGFDKTVAVKLVNSIMVMKSAQEAFATVDMCVIDLYTGEVEFMKNGAEPSYIKKPDHAEIVRAASLPVGLVSAVDVETFARRLEVGDTIVMVTDGIEQKDGKNGWIRDLIERADAKMPAQELADQIMEKSVALKGGEPDDDMTVIVLRLEAGANAA